MTDGENKGGKVVLLMVLGLALLFGGLYVAAYLAAGDKVPRGATVAGVEIGDRSAADAEEALREGLADREDRADHRRRRRRGGPRSSRTRPVSRSTTTASVAAAGGEQSWSPGRLWDYWTGGDDLDAVVDVDDAAFEATLEGLAEQVGTPPTDGAIRFRDGDVVVTDPADGEEVDPDAARAAITDAYLVRRRGRRPRCRCAAAGPDIDQADVAEGARDLRQPRHVRAGHAGLRRLAGAAPARGVLEGAGHARRGRRAGAGPEREGADQAGRRRHQRGRRSRSTRRSRSSNGKPKVIPAKPGVTYDPDDVSSAFLELVTRTGDEREMKVKATVAEPEFTTADARALKIRGQVSTFTTYYPYAEYRNINIGRAAELVDGTVLKPGDVFSLNDIVGERTAENGFTEGTIISDGIFKQDLGGGVSQMATTTFNAMFFAGLKDIEHKPHSFYIDRYPVGREATVAWGAVDLRFENDTPYGVLVHATVQPSTPSSQGVVTVSM